MRMAERKNSQINRDITPLTQSVIKPKNTSSPTFSPAPSRNGRPTNPPGAREVT